MALSKLVIALVCSFMLGAGCGGTVCPAQLFNESSSLLASYGSTRSYVETLKAEARLEQRGRGGRLRATIWIMMHAPNQLRFDITTQFGPAMIATYDGKRFAMTDVGRQRYRFGVNCERELGRKLGLPFSARDIASILVGGLPELPLREEIPFCKEGSYQVHFKLEGGDRLETSWEVREQDQKLPSSEQRLRLREALRMSAQGKVLWRVQYNDYAVIPAEVKRFSERQGVAIPQTLNLEVPEQRINTEIRYKDIQLNRALDDKAFQQKPRSSMNIRALNCS